ncbi:Pan6 [Kluyveromyces lactis]|nr:Pan6 [Kluyveromyces lactis]
MQVLRTVAEVRAWRKQENVRNDDVGFVPTMGCLHQGHASLIQQSIKDNKFTVVSIFVNPSQFAPTEDLDKYPRTLDADKKLLEQLGVDAVFVPQPKDIYPRGIPLDVSKQVGPFISVLGLSEKLEGKTRPNFFRGVATVVGKLFNIVQPTKAYFGQKDFQQFVVLQNMVKELFFDLELVMMPITRSATSGLALSSRNKYLCEESLEIAANIYKGLKDGAQLITKNQATADVTRDHVLDAIQSRWIPYYQTGDFKLDYISIADVETLDEVETLSIKSQDIVISCAVYVRDRSDSKTTVRLIDNVLVPGC